MKSTVDNLQDNKCINPLNFKIIVVSMRLWRLLNLIEIMKWFKLGHH